MANNSKSIKIIISAIAFILIVAISALVGILVELGTIKWDSSPLLIMFSLLTLLTGTYVIGYGAISKSGYSFGVGTILFDIGAVCLLITLKVKLLIIIIVAISLVLISFAFFFLLKAKELGKAYETTDSKEDFIPYMEKLKQEKQQEEKTELPEIKSFKD